MHITRCPRRPDGLLWLFIVLVTVAGWGFWPDEPVKSSLHGVSEFEPVWYRMTHWVEGFSKVSASVAVLVGLINSLRARSWLPLAVGLGCGLAFVFMPDFVHWMVTGRLSHGY